MTNTMRAVGLAIALLVGGKSFAADPAAIERGKYLTTIGICSGCHTPTDQSGKRIEAMRFAGGGKAGGLNTPNLTPDPETGLGKWTEDQIVEALRNGKRPDGGPVRPPMGVFFYRALSDSDARAIAAYLLSLPPVSNKVERSASTAPLPTYEPVTHVAEPNRADKLAYGEYIGKTVAHCLQCHTPRVNGLPDLSRAGGGGNSYNAPGGGSVVAANITPGNADGIAKWTDDQLKAVITKGVRPDGSHLVGVMEFDRYAAFTPEDLDMLAGFLRSLKPVAMK